MITLKQKLRNLIANSIILNRKVGIEILAFSEKMSEEQMISLISILDTEKEFIDKILDQELKKPEKQKIYQEFLDSINIAMKKILVFKENESINLESLELDDLENQLNNL